MALYSWFLRTKTKQSNKTVKINNDLLKASESVKYIENYTMWPTATIKQNVKVTQTSFNNKTASYPQVVLSTKTALIPIKN